MLDPLQTRHTLAAVLVALWTGAASAQDLALEQFGSAVLQLDEPRATGLAAGRHAVHLYSDGSRVVMRIDGRDIGAVLRGCPEETGRIQFGDGRVGRAYPGEDGAVNVVLESSVFPECRAHGVIPAQVSSRRTTRSQASEAILPALRCDGGSAARARRAGGDLFCQCPRGQSAVALAPNHFSCGP